MALYVPGTEETDPKKQNQSLQLLGGAISALQTSLTALQADYASLTNNNSFAGTQTVTNATDASSSTVGGAFTIAGGLAIAKKFFAGTSVNSPVVKSTAAPGTAWGIDCSASTIAIAGAGNAVLPDGAGLILITDGTSTGDTGMYLTGGSNVALVSQSVGTSFVAATTTPGAGKYSIAFNGTHYAIYNGAVGSITFYVAMIRARDTV